MRSFIPDFAVLGAFVLVNLIGATVFLMGKARLYVLPDADSRWWLGLIVGLAGVTAGVASAFPIFRLGVPWIAERLNRLRQ